MSYQQFSNQQQPPPVSVPPPGMHHQTTTVVSGPQPTPAVVQTKPYNPFAPKAALTKKLGIFILFLGIITFIFGIAMAVAAPEWWASISGGGIWTGIFVIIVGSLCIGAGSNEDARGVRIGALVMGIIALIFTCSSGIMNLIAFIVGINCNDCYWVDNDRICDNNCYYNDASAGSIMSLVLMLLNLTEFVVILIACIFTGRGCCTGSAQSSTGVIVASQQTYGSVMVASGHQVGAPYPHAQYPQAQYPQSQYTQAQYPQASAPGPVYSQPQYSQQPPQPQQQPYAPQQQYSQAPMGAQAGEVTYNSDYGQQKNEEQKVNPDVPPPYSQHA